MKNSILATLATLTFPVEKVKLGKNNFLPGFEFNPKCTHAIVAKIEEKRKILNFCSKGYGLVTNDSIIDPIRDIVDQYGDLELKVKTFNDSRFFLDFIFKDNVNKLMQKGDIIYPRMRINNSYDGGVRFSIIFGFYRLVCTNGLMVPLNGKESRFIFKHTYNTAKNIEEKVGKELENFINNTPKILHEYDNMLKKEINLKNLENEISTVLSVVDNFPKKRNQEIYDRVLLEKKEGFPLNNFVLYNAFNHILYNDGSEKMQLHKKDKIDAKVLAYLNK